MSIRFCTISLNLQNCLTIFFRKHLFPPRHLHYRLSNSSQNCHNHRHFSCRVAQDGAAAAAAAAALSDNTSLSASSTTPITDSGFDDVLMGYMLGKKKATEVAHLVWKHFVRKGDTVVDATCGNGFDTLAMLKMVKDDLGGGSVYGMDIQEDAVKRTSSLLDSSLNPTERKSVRLFTCCHSRMLEVLPKYSSVRGDVILIFILTHRANLFKVQIIQSVPSVEPAFHCMPKDESLPLDVYVIPHHCNFPHFF